jgi:perosamine synthetase
MSLFSPIHHSFAPLGNAAQCRLALICTLMPWRYRHVSDVRALEAALGKRYNAEAVAFGSGRESMLALVRALGLTKNDEVIEQGYTCIVMPNAIHAGHLKTVYADIEKETLNFDLDALQEVITPKTRMIVSQNTFGIPAHTKVIRDICDAHSLFMLEDCAHILPDEKGPQEIGQYGDAMLASFARDKAISGVSGGAIITRNPEVAAKLRKEQEAATPESLWKIFALLQYPIIYAIAKPLYGIKIGKALLVLAAKIKILVPTITAGEKKGEMSSVVHTMPGACAVLALQQLNALQSMNDHRRMLTDFYLDFGRAHDWPLLSEVQNGMAMQKFPMFTKGADAIRTTLKKMNIHLSDGWCGCVICPESADPRDAGYEPGLDPSAESVGEQILSLPTHPTMSKKQAILLATILDPLLHTK